MSRGGPDAAHAVRAWSFATFGPVCLGGQGVAADRAVAGAQFVGLQGVDDAKRVFRRTADVQVGDINVLDDVVRVDDEGRAQGHAFFFVQHAQGAGQLAAVVGELPDRQLVQVGVDRKSTRLNSSHVKISYAVFCLKKKPRRDSVMSAK